MTLTQLRDRLNTVIAEHEASGQGERNHLEMILELERFGPLRKNGRRGYYRRYFTLNHVQRVQLGINGHQYIPIITSEDNEVKPGKAITSQEAK